MYPQPGMMPMQPNLGSSHYPPTFSYAPTTASAQHRGGAYMGSTLASGTVGAAQGIVNTANIGLMGVGAIQGVSSLLGAPMLTGGMLGAATGAGAGGVGGFALGMLGGPLGLGLMAAGAGLSVANTGIQNANRVGNMFGNMQFANATGDPRTGRGFSQSDLMTLQRGVRAIDANNPFVSMSDALRATERFTEMGMHQGVQDAEKLAKKVTQLGKTMHQMARSLGTSMEEAGQIFKDMRGSGFYSAQDVMGNTANMTLMRGFGMSSQQFAQMQRTGAGMTRGAQMSGRAGAGMITAKTAEFMDAIRTGQMSSEEMMDMTGASSPLEAAQMMAQQTLAGTMGGLSGALGTGMLLAAGATDKSGRFTGEIDAGILRRMSQGSLSRNELMDIGGGKRNSRIGQASFMARRQDIMESMLESDQGQEALFGMVRSITEEMFGEGAGEDQDLFQLVAETQFNMDRRAVRKLQELKDGRGQRLSALKREIATNQRAADLRENRTLAGATQRMSGFFSDVGTDMADPFSEGYRNFVSGMQDAERVLVSGSRGVVAGTSEAAIKEELRKQFGASLKGEGAAVGDVGIGTAARMSAATGNLGMFQSHLQGVAVPEDAMQMFQDYMNLPGGSGGAHLAHVAKGKSLEDISRSILETGEFAGAKDRGAFFTAIGTPNAEQYLALHLKRATGLDDEGVAALLSQQGGTAGAKLARKLSMSSVSGQDLETQRKDAQMMGRMALYGEIGTMAAGGTLADADTAYGRIGAAITLGALPALIDTEFEIAADELLQGGEATGLLARYGDFQQEIDQEIADAIVEAGGKEEGMKLAAKRLSERFGLKLSAKDVAAVNTVMTDRSGKTASERRHGIDKKLAKSLSDVGKKLNSAEAETRVGEELNKLVRTSKGLLSVEAQKGISGDRQSQLGQTIRALAKEGFTATARDSVEAQTAAFGVSVFNRLTEMEEGGLTKSEILEAMQGTGIDEKYLETFLADSGISISGGRISAQDQGRLKESLAGQSVAALSALSRADKEQFFSGGMTEMERQSLSVYKTAEMVDSLYDKLKADDVIKVNDPGGD